MVSKSHKKVSKSHKSDKEELVLQRLIKKQEKQAKSYNDDEEEDEDQEIPADYMLILSKIKTDMYTLEDKKRLLRLFLYEEAIDTVRHAVHLDKSLVEDESCYDDPNVVSKTGITYEELGYLEYIYPLSKGYDGYHKGWWSTPPRPKNFRYTDSCFIIRNHQQDSDDE